MSGMEPGIIAAIIGGVATVGSTVVSAISSNKQADKAAERQAAYNKQLAAQEAASKAEENRITQEALQRSKAYGASLLDSGSQLDNVLSGGFSDDLFGNSSILRNSLSSSSVSSIFA